MHLVQMHRNYLELQLHLQYAKYCIDSSKGKLLKHFKT